MKEKILLIDGHGVIYRAFYALPLLTNKSGIYTNAIYGFLNIILKAIDIEKPDYIAIAFDVSSKTFRTEQFAEYKGTRKPMPEELRSQIPVLKDLLSKMNIEQYELKGFEADDILGTISRVGEKDDKDVVILSGDRDLLQLATKNTKIKLIKSKGGKTDYEDYYEDDVIERYEVTPIEFIDLKGLMGDVSDNIPGVPGIGEKTATKIIKEYKTIEAAIDDVENIKPKRARENLDEYREQAIMSKELATIMLDVPIEININSMKINDIYTEQAKEAVVELELKTLYKRFDKAKVVEENYKYDIIDNPFDGELFIEEVLSNENVLFKFDFNYVSFYIDNKVKIFLPDDTFNLIDVIKIVKPFLESDISKITHNSKKLFSYCIENNINLKNIKLDIELGAYILNPEKDNYEYNTLAMEFLNEVYPSIEEILGKGKSKISFELLPEEEKIKYISREIFIYNNVLDIMQNQIIENNQENLLYNIEVPLAEVMASMEELGIKVSKVELENYGKELDGHIKDLENNILELAGEEFNINSPKQLGLILFEKLGLKGGKKTKTGYSTSAQVLEKLEKEHPIIAYVLEYRTYTKLKSTYVDGLIHEIDEKTSRIYSKFSQTTTTTGRISSVEPNLQNIPIKLEVGKKLRKAFIPKDDYIFMSADYSQIELRVLAHISDDEEMIDAYKNNKDIHRLTASQVYRVPFEEVTSYQRSNAKAVNFGIVYGISSYSLSQDLEITRKEAERYIQGYFFKYPKVKEYLDNAVLEAKENGYAKTIFERRRSIPELTSSNFNIRGFGERIAMNMPIQGSAADIIKISMLKVYNRLKDEKLKSKLILQVHDELMLEVKKSEKEIVEKILKDEMENACKLKVPLTVDLEIGDNWYNLK